MEYKGSLKLSVFGDFIAVPIAITHKELEVGTEVIIKIEYQGNEFLGMGKSLNWADAFANLQKALPSGIKIQCCMTCRHGTLCPYGNIPNYILCSQNAVINSKDDVIDWLDNVDVKKIKRSAFGCCEKFKSSNKNDYTYNDYFYYLNH